MDTSLSWRAAHVWLRGYSDGKLGRRIDKLPDGWEPYTDFYDRGHDVGSDVGKDEPAFAPPSCEDGTCHV